jgi:cytochrome P450
VSRSIERLRPRVIRLAHDLIDRFPATGPVDLLPAFATPIPVIVIAELLGVPVERADDLLDWSHKMVAMYQFNRARSVEDAAVAATQAFVAFMRDYVEERRKTPADDLISHLIAAESAGDRLSTDELITTCILLLNAGHEATVHGIGNGVRALLRERVAPAEAFRDASATERCIDELLRFDPSLHLFTRYALEPVTIAGHDFKVGDQIGLLLAAANRDPTRFRHADRLKPDRDEGTHIAFGAGIHFCIGQPLARLEMQCALPVLFERLPRLELADEPRFADRYHFHGLERLDVAYTAKP